MYADIFSHGDELFFPFQLSVHVNGVLGYQKHIFRKSVCRVEFFKNAGLSLFFCGRTKTEVLEYDDVIHYTAHVL